MLNLHQGRGLALGRLGEFDRTRRDYEMVLELARSNGKEVIEWRALLELGRLWTSRDYNLARDYFEAALELARELDEPVFLADSLNWIGNWYVNNERFDKAVIFHDKALAIFEDLENQQELANTLDLLGLAYLLGGNLSSSINCYNRAITLFRELDDRPRLVSSLIGRATKVSVLSSLNSVPIIPAPDAIADFDEAWRLAEEIGSASDQAWICWSSGLLYTVYGQFGEALSAIEKGMTIASEIEHREYMVGNLCTLGNCLIELFAPMQALAKYEDALALAEELCSPTWIHLAVVGLVKIHRILNDIGTSQSYLDRLLSTDTPMDTLGKRQCWIQQVELEVQYGDLDLALDITDRLIAEAPGMFPGCVITYLWKLKGEILAAKGYVQEGSVFLKEAIKNAELAGERFLLWRLHAALGNMYHVMGNEPAREIEYSTARVLVDALASTIGDETLTEGFRHGANRILETH